MTRFNHWMAPLVAFAIAIGFGATSNAQQNEKQSDKKQEQSSKDSGGSQSNSQGSSQSQPANSGGQQKSDSGSQSGSQSDQSSTQSNQRSDSQADNNRQQSGSQSSANQNKSDQDSKSNQSQSNQTQSNQRSQSDNRTGQTNAQGTNTRSNQSANQGAQNNQNNQNRDNQANKGDNKNNDNRNDRNNDRNNQTNIAVGIQFGSVNDRGLVINTVQNNSFFYRAGFRQNDVIVSFAGQPIRNQAAFIEYVTVHRGERIPVIVLRDGRQETVYVEYTEADLGPGQAGIGGDTAVLLLGVTFDSQIPNAAVVQEVHPGGAAAAAGIKQGDEIVVINGQRVSGLQSVNQIVGRMKAGEKVEIDYLQLKHAQVTLADSGNRTAAGTGVRVDQGVQQSNYQAGAAGVGVGVGVQAGQGSNNQGQNADRNQQNRNQNQTQNQNQNNRGGIIPRIR